jgi:hypothetical protein
LTFSFGTDLTPVANGFIITGGSIIGVLTTGYRIANIVSTGIFVKAARRRAGLTFSFGTDLTPVTDRFVIAGGLIGNRCHDIAITL